MQIHIGLNWGLGIVTIALSAVSGIMLTRGSFYYDECFYRSIFLNYEENCKQNNTGFILGILASVAGLVQTGLVPGSLAFLSEVRAPAAETLLSDSADEPTPGH